MLKKFMDIMSEYYKEQEHFTSRFKKSSGEGNLKWTKFKKNMAELYDELDYFYGGRKTSNTAGCKSDKNYKKVA
ncbi:hypothetical protein SAMN02745945_00493 [Peptoclostridium litorale DSM 5388]|uniref:Uncharacterized protein n=1 Tax=Peptoclostridium litorale DSM 5388 TaxID=1121324 RepID=A0A069RDP4_PEPLI|nr:hypothetical protein [Peptoclostridium litorale]KDR95136.1 hypothetical protein CLIT_11c01650 [Peptoclostridium litorale DSM 5388]SIN74438.1 hypothetical protein SAMN02745945_00493 [Peptoclostridium litorale DSM 5388]